ncbi:MAG: tRNA (adenosine(37)-N6)-dimethylallyltransferase MiaA [Cyanobacteria bacterium K_Offshore_surface_m2_239]|nr:tRNA (adenosine(37)-N6)-dimethylallyltransferase MiaA [Cyanobacteria bacterium K_Offshore_surface_m2_239]
MLPRSPSSSRESAGPPGPIRRPDPDPGGASPLEREPAGRVIALMGPTASGKTALALELAEALDLAVISVDARQCYIGMDIGTAKPTAEQRQRVRHELLDLRPPDQPLTLQEFLPLARAAVSAELQRRGLALVVGGSGLYLQGLLRGLTPPAVPPQPSLRDQFQGLGQPLCHSLLRACDPAAAARIAPADSHRTQRALEICYATGQPASAQGGRVPPPWPVLELALDPADLPDRIHRRTLAMYAEGLVEETEALIARHGEALPLLDTMGYDEARGLLRGQWPEARAIALTERRTRQYAKRQRTWFRRQHQPVWLRGEDLMQNALLTLQTTRQGLG